MNLVFLFILQKTLNRLSKKMAFNEQQVQVEIYLIVKISDDRIRLQTSNLYLAVVKYNFQIVQNEVPDTDGSGDMDRCFRRADRHMVRAMGTFRIRYRYRVLLDLTRCARA